MYILYIYLKELFPFDFFQFHDGQQQQVSNLNDQVNNYHQNNNLSYYPLELKQNFDNNLKENKLVNEMPIIPFNIYNYPLRNNNNSSNMNSQIVNTPFTNDISTEFLAPTSLSLSSINNISFSDSSLGYQNNTVLPLNFKLNSNILGKSPDSLLVNNANLWNTNPKIINSDYSYFPVNQNNSNRATVSLSGTLSNQDYLNDNISNYLKQNNSKLK